MKGEFIVEKDISDKSLDSPGLPTSSTRSDGRVAQW
jgi:hypothetical protein